MNPRLRLVLHGDQSVPFGRPIDRYAFSMFGLAEPRLGYVSADVDAERAYFEYRRCYYDEVGASLSVYVGPETGADASKWKQLFSCDAIHLSGGDPIKFAGWLVSQAKAAHLKSYADDGGLLLGVSAGAILLTPSLACAALGDPSELNPVPSGSALSLVPFHFWPHYLPGQELLPGNRSILSRIGRTYACQDGGAVIVSGGKVTTHGPVHLLVGGDSEA